MAEGKINAMKYPVFGMDWQRDASNQSLVAIAGGGGALKSGIKNCVVCCKRNIFCLIMASKLLLCCRLYVECEKQVNL